MPGVVKGSKQSRMVVVPHRPRRGLLFGAGLVMALGLSALLGFLYGDYRAQFDQRTVAADREGLVSELNAAREQNEELSRQIAILDRTSVMDQRANAEVQATIRGLRERVAQLEQDIVYYRQVVAEESGETGLTISRLDIDPAADPGHYRYKLVMRQQDADGDTFLTGHVNVSLVGRMEDDLMVLPLREISEEQDQLDIRLRFKFFQNIEGELALPEGFVPERVQVAAVENEPIEKDIRQDFGWVVNDE